MTPLEAIAARHSVRKYLDKAIPEELLSQLREKIAEINAGGNLHVQLVTDEPKAFGGLKAYGQFSGVRYYFVMAGSKSKDLDERVGYYGEQLVLLAQALGLNTCWAGVSYNKIPGTYELCEDETIACYIALGYGQTQGVSHKSKAPGSVSNASDLTPGWFREGVQAALLAPTAVNQQKFFIEYLGVRNKQHVVSIKKGVSMVGYTLMDLGIVKLHFEIGAGKERFVWAE